MDWYAAVGRPAFFSLEPETAHRVAGALLELPLPWARIGAVVEDPALATELAGLRLVNPVGLAAGFDKTCGRLHSLGRLGFGSVVGGTITRHPRVGNPRPRIARSVRSGSMVNAMGLPNPGAEAAAANLRRFPATSIRVVSLADESVRDVAESLELMEPLVDGVELNASCPNVSWGRDRDNEEHLRSLVGALRRRTAKPLLVKLPPFDTPVEREAVLSLARLAHEGGVDGLTCSNTRPVATAALSTGGGGLSGRALWPGTVERVAAVVKATEGELDVVACGGIETADDVVACLRAGAASVQIYTSLIYRGPAVVGEITRGMSEAGVVVADLAATT